MGVAKKIGQHFLWRGLYLVSVFVINLLMARILGASDSGKFYLLLNNLSLIVLLIGFSLESALVYFSAGGEIASQKLVTLTIIWSLLVLAGSFLFLLILGKKSYDWQEILIICYPFAYILINNISGLFQGSHNFKTYNIILTGVNLALIAHLVYTLIVIGGEQSGYPPVRDIFSRPGVRQFYFLSILLQGILLLIFFGKQLPVSKWQLPSLAELKTILKYAALAWGANLVFFLVYRVDYWMIDYFLNSDPDLGNYIQASKFVQLFVTIPALAASVIFPSTVVNDPILMRVQLARACRVLFSGFLVALTFIALTGRFLFPLLYGSSFQTMYLPFIAMIPGILAISMQSLLAAWYAGTNQVKHNIYGALIALALIVSLDIFFIPAFGIIGAAIASSIAYIAYFLYQFFIFTRQTAVTIWDFIWINKKDIRWARELLLKKGSI